MAQETIKDTKAEPIDKKPEMNQTTSPSRASNEALNAKIGGQLSIAKRIGRGRLGAVYAGVHPVLARRFAIKILKPSLARDESVQRRLRRVIREVSIVEHPNVVSLVDYGQLPEGNHYLIMEFVHGSSLSKALSQEARFSVVRSLRILIQLAEALEAAHQLHVVHGDVKPNNILLMELPNSEVVVRVIDFALTQALASKASKEDPLGHLRIFSTFDYLSPEQINNARVDGRADIYAYGAVAYRMLTGEPPFVGEGEDVLMGHRTRTPVPPSRRTGAHDVPAKLDNIILRCLEKNPEDRFKTMGEVSRELRLLLPQAQSSPMEEEITGRWKLPTGAEKDIEEPLPESPTRLRQLFYDTLLELADWALKEGVASEEMGLEVSSLRKVKDEVALITTQAAIIENRFEDIRRDLRERESTLRYAMIDLNLAKNDAKKSAAGEENVNDTDFQIAELERNLADLEQKRSERFSALNQELQKNRDLLKSMEQKLAIHYRRIYAYLDDVETGGNGVEARRLHRRLERYRTALAKAASAH